MASLLRALWPGILGAVVTAYLIYLSLTRSTNPRRRVAVLKWREELSEANAQEAGRQDRRLEG